MTAEMRAHRQLAVTIAAGASVSGAIHMAGLAGAIVIMPAAWTTADLGIKVCGSPDGTFVPFKDRSNGYGTDVSIDGPVANAAYPLPPYVWPAPYIQLFSHNGSGEAVNQAAARTIIVLIKA